MSDETNETSGLDTEASGQSESISAQSPETSETSVGDSSQQDGYPEPFVKKLLSEKKNVSARAKELENRLAEYEAKEKQRHEDNLKKQKKWEEFAKLKEQEAQDAMSKLQTVNQRIENATRFNALLDALPGTVEKQYYPLIEAHLTDIVLNPETGMPDEVSVKSVAERVRDNYSKILDFGNSPNMPDGSPKPSNVDIVSRWDSLSPEEKKENLPKFVEQRLNKQT